jgi:hypothetical protein
MYLGRGLMDLGGGLMDLGALLAVYCATGAFITIMVQPTKRRKKRKGK